MDQSVTVRGAKDKHTVTGGLGSTQTETKQDAKMKRCYPSGSNKRKKRKDTDKYLATLPKMTHFFTATVVGVGDTDRNNAQSVEHAATAASATASCEVALVVVEDNINQEINEKDITLLPPAVTDSVIDFDTDEVEELSSDGHFDTDDDDDGALIFIGIMKSHDGVLKAMRGKNLPLEVQTNWSSEQVLIAGENKVKDFNQDMEEGSYVLLHPDCSEVKIFQEQTPLTLRVSDPPNGLFKSTEKL
ncbi:uncharacterized protein LOC131549126 [Onychostoma macrolepis]|uniref:uncharacterized protein LOC131549126 n=1 Tax=Onychostoma macrolepis TaxID=369639 RepID=UPI00272B02AB|nr:uncharacterized protein LOC131549126 [Onychostoma macrolepis]